MTPEQENALGNILTKLNNRGGAATEATQELILEALGGKKGGSSGVAKEQERLVTATRRTGSYLGDLGEEAEETSQALEDLKSKTLGAMSAGFSIMTGNLSGVGDALNTFSYQFRGVTGMLIRGLAQVSNLFSENVDTFRALSQIGGAYGQGLNDLRQIAGQAGIRIDMLAGSALQLGSNLALLGESSATSQREFLKTVQAMTTGETRKQFSALGFTMEEVVDATANFAEIQTRLGRFQQMDEMQRSNLTEQYILELDTLTRLTGKNRQQLQDEMKERANDERLNLKLSGMTQEQQMRVNKALSLTTAINGDLGNELKNLIAQDGVAFNERQAGIMEMKGMREAMAALNSGEPGSVNALMKVFQDQAIATKNLSKEQRDALTLQKQAGVSFNDFYFLTLNAGKVMKDMTKVSEEQRKALEKGAKSALQFDQATMALRESFKALLAPVFEVLGSALGGLAEIVMKVATTIQKMDDGILKLIATLGVVGLGGYGVAKAGGAVLKGGAKMAGSFLPGAGMFKTLGAGGGAMMSGAAKGISSFAALGPKILMGAGIIAGVVAILGAGVGIGAFAAGKGIQTLAEGLTSFQNVDGEKLKEVASASSKLSLAITQMGANSVKGAVTGFFGKLFGGGPENFAKSINKTLDELDKNKIDMYANSLQDLGNAMTNLRSGMTGSITASSSSTGDKLDRLNTTMEQILMVLGEGNRYGRITSQATQDTAENFG